MTTETKWRLRAALQEGDGWSFRDISIRALEDFASESGHLLPPEAMAALRKLICEFDEAGPSCVAPDEEAHDDG